MKGIFVTSNNTDSGKTFISTRLLKVFKEYQMHPYKPIETACPRVNGVLHPRDAHMLGSACDDVYDIEVICPYQFTLEASGALASEHADISLYDLVEKVPSECVLVEGAGGFFSPLLPSVLNADLAKTLSLPVVIVVRNVLGAISEALLTIAAVKSYGLDIFAVVLNTQHPNALHNLEELSKYTEETIIEYSYDEQFIAEVKHVIEVWAVAKK